MRTSIKRLMHRNSKVKQRSVSEIFVYLIATVFLNIWAISLLYPLFFGLNSALKESGNAFMLNPVSIVIFNKPAWSNFTLAFQTITYNEVTFIEMTLNSLFFSTIPNLVAVFFTTAVGYVVCKYDKYKIMGFVYSFILIIQLIPLYGNLPATYKLFSQLGFINSPTIVIASFGVSFANFLYIYAFFKAVPWTYAESAFVDGAGHWRVFLQIMLPQVVPSVSVIFILSFISSWNDFQTCMLYYADAIPTLSYGIFAFYNKSIYMANQPVYMAACLLASIPSMVLFLIFQNQIMNRLMVSGIKG